MDTLLDGQIVHELEPAEEKYPGGQIEHDPGLHNWSKREVQELRGPK